MTNIRRVGIQTGLIGGLLFLVHALVPYSGSYPYLWPVVTGAVAAWRATADVRTHRGRQGLLAVLIAGAVVGLVAAIGLSVALVGLQRTIADLAGPARAAGAVAAAELSFLVLSLIAAVATWLGGALVIPFRLRGSSTAP